MSEIYTIIEDLEHNIINENNIFYCNGTLSINNDTKIFYINKNNKPDYINIVNENQNKINDLINSCNNNVLLPDKFSLDNKFNICNTEIIHLIHKLLKYDIDANNIYSELKHLKIYTKDNIQVPIVLNKNYRKIGSIVIILPSIIDDAVIKIINGKNTKSFNLSNNLLIKWYYFDSNYNYEIINIKKGQIITLIYDLYINYNNIKNIKLEDINFFNTLKKLKEKKEQSGNTLGFMLQHEYMNLVNFNKDTDFMEKLKGTDLKLFILCKELKLEIKFTGILFLEYISEKQIKKIFYENEYLYEENNDDTEEDECVKKLVIENMKDLDYLSINGNDARIQDENDLLIMLRDANAEYRPDIKWVSECKYSYYKGSYTEYLPDGINGGYVIKQCLVTGAFLINI